VGIYSVGEAARLLQVRADSLRRWIAGYTFRSYGVERFSRAVVEPQLRQVHPVRLLTFLDLIELKFVALFRQEGVSMPVIRAAAERGARLFSSDHPFAVRRFTTDGKTIFAVLAEPGARPSGVSNEDLIQDLNRAQYVIGHIAEPYFRKIDWGTPEALRLWPLGRAGRIVIDPQRCLGKPIDAPTGVPTYTLYQAARSGESSRAVAEWYEVPIEAVLKSVEYESLLAPA